MCTMLHALQGELDEMQGNHTKCWNEIWLSFLKIEMVFHVLIKLYGGMLECAVFTTYFYSLQRESQQIWILFASYSHHSLHVRFKIFAQMHTNIRFDAKNTCCSEFSLTSKYSLKIFSYWQIFAKLYAKFHIQVKICLQVSHICEYLLANIRIPMDFHKLSSFISGEHFAIWRCLM